MSEWISVKERLPERHAGGDDCPAVVVFYADGVLADNLIRISTSNTEFLRLHPEQFTHWMPLPEPPNEVSK